MRRESSMNPWALDWLLIEIEFNSITCLCKSLKGNVVTEFRRLQLFSVSAYINFSTKGKCFLSQDKR